MSTLRHTSDDPIGIALRLGVIVLALATAYIHSTFGGPLFLANAAGYVVLAAAMIVPHPLASRYRWLIRLALIGFTLATIAAWVAFGGRFLLAYVDKAIEVALVVVLAIEAWRYRA